MNKFKWKQLSVRFPDLRELEMRLKILCVCYHHTVLRAEVGLRAGFWAAHLWWPGRGQRCTPGSCSRHSRRVLRRGPGTPPPPRSTAAAPPLGGARLPGVAPLNRVALPVGTGPTGRKRYSNAGQMALSPTSLFMRVLISCSSHVMKGKGGRHIMKTFCKWSWLASFAI